MYTLLGERPHYKKEGLTPTAGTLICNAVAKYFSVKDGITDLWRVCELFHLPLSAIRQIKNIVSPFFWQARGRFRWKAELVRQLYIRRIVCDEMTKGVKQTKKAVFFMYISEHNNSVIQSYAKKVFASFSDITPMWPSNKEAKKALL